MSSDGKEGQQSVLQGLYRLSDKQIIVENYIVVLYQYNYIVLIALILAKQ